MSSPLKNPELPVSVVLRVFNAESYVSAAIESVRQQTPPIAELIVVDDGSTDGSLARILASAGPIRYLSQENRGPAAALNAGIKAANHDYLAFIDADDLWPNEKLNWQMRLLHSHPEWEIVSGAVRRFSEVANLFYFEPETIRGAFFGAALFRRSVFKRVGLLCESLRYSEDVDWFLRAKEMGIGIHFSSETALFYRQHENNLTKDRCATQRGLFSALQRSAARRRERNKCRLL